MRKEIDELSRMTVGQLRQKYVEVAECGLSERARRRALEIANDADLCIRAPNTMFWPADSVKAPRRIRCSPGSPSDLLETRARIDQSQIHLETNRLL